MNGSIMQLYQFLCAVIVLVASIHAEQKATCSVPFIPNGNIQEGGVFNWTTNRWESYRNVSVGTISSHNTTFLLVCDKNHSFKGIGASRIRITCSNKKFSPDPICLKKTCSVPLIPNGKVQEGNVFNWTTNRWVSYRNVSIGTLALDSTTFLLVCDEDYSFEGAGPSRIRITCSNKKFSPDPICLKTCSVPMISNGNIQEGDVFNWTANRWASYRNVSVGTLLSDNTTVLLVCDENHSFKGEGASRIRITCSNKKFSPDPICLRTILCPLIDEKDVFNVLYNNGRKIDSKAILSCKDINKKIVDDSYTKTCLTTGKWSGGSPECKATCAVPFIPNGNIQEGNVFNWTTNRWESYRNVSVGTLSSDNTTFLLACDEDHSFKGAGVASRVRIRCSNEKFLPNPVCLKRTCSVPLVPNGNIQERVGFGTSDLTPGWTPDLTTDLKPNLTPDRSNKSVSVGSISSHNTALLLVCDEDHSIQEEGVSSIEITCSNGQWSPDPVCRKSIMCPPIEEKGIFIVVYNNGRKINSTARFYCKDGNQEIVGGNDTWTCLPTGNWLGGIPDCKVSQCAIKDLLESASGILVPNSESEVEEIVPTGMELPLRCRGNLILVGSTKAKCGRNGKWENRMHKCIRGCHLDHKSISSGLITDPDKLNFNFGEHVDLSCPLGMKLTSNVQMLMCLGSTWSDEIPKCQ